MTYNTVMFQNATLGSTVIAVEAIDADVGPNAAVRYRLKQDNTGDWRTFSIDQDSGLITLKQPLDREKQKTYQVCYSYSVSDNFSIHQAY